MAVRENRGFKALPLWLHFCIPETSSMLYAARVFKPVFSPYVSWFCLLDYLKDYLIVILLARSIQKVCASVMVSVFLVFY